LPSLSSNFFVLSLGIMLAYHQSVVDSSLAVYRLYNPSST
jgi:hypothetical protein